MWSAGILLYQMLFGRRPFGHDQTQERILREDTIIKARKVEFPSRPSVSNEAKVVIFIPCCISLFDIVIILQPMPTLCRNLFVVA